MLFSKPLHRILSSSIARLLQPRFLARRILIPGASLILLEGIATKGATYTWTNPNGGSWSTSTNWVAGGVPVNPGDIADFSQLGLGANEIITLDGNETAGALLFGDTGDTYDTTLANGAGGPWTLTLAASTASPVVNVANDNAIISAILAGTQGLTKTGAGNLVLAGANTYTGTTTVAGGTLTLDFSQPGAPASNIIGNSTPGNLTLSDGGNLALVGNPLAASSQSFAGLTVSSGADTITLNQNGATSVTLALGPITQTVGGTLNFPTVPNTGTLVVTTTNSNVNGILGPWATVGTGSATEYATVNSSGDIVGYTGATTAAGTLATVNSATTNYAFTAAGTLTASRTANTLQYSGTGTTTALGAFTLTLNGLLNTGSGTLTFSSTTGGIQIGATNELVIQGGSVTIKAPIFNNGSNASSVTYSGTGTLTLNTTASTYTGTTTVNSGTLSLGLANVLNSASNLVVNGGTVALGANSESVSGVTLTSGTISGTTGTLTSASAFNLQSGTVSAILNGSVAINKTTFGNVTISKTATLGTSGVNIKAGTITTGVLNALSNGNNVTLGDSTANTGATLNLDGFNQTVGILTAVGAGQNIVTNNAAAGSLSIFTIGGASTFSGSIQDGTGGVSLVKSNANTTTLTGANTFTGGTTVNNGTLILAGGDNRLAATGAILLGTNTGNAGTLELGNTSAAINQTVGSIARTSGDTVTTNKIIGGYYKAATPTAYSTLTVNYTNTASPDTYVGFLGSGTVGVTAANNFSFTKTGAGNLILNPVGANTYIDGTNVNGGTLALGAAGALPAGGVVNIGGGTLDLAGFSSSVGAVTLVSGGIKDSVGGAVLSGSSYLVDSGTIGTVLGDGASPSALTKTTSGTVTLSSQDTYSGGTFINSGTLTLGTANALPITGAVTVAGGLLDLGGFSATVGTVTLSNGGIINSGGGATLTGSSYVVQSGTINAVLGGVGSTLTKNSTDTVTLTAANTYTGLTLVNAGTLNVSSQQTGGGAFSVGDGSTLNVNLAASGQSLVTSALTVGTSGGGTLSFGLGTFGNPTAPVINTGTLTLNGANIINVTGGGLSIGEFPLIAYTGSIAGGGSFALGTLPARITASLDYATVPQEILLDITGYDIPHWTGAINGNWDIDDGTGTVGTLNWALSGGASTGYYQGGAVGTDSILFDNSATGTKTVDLTTTLTPIAITVNNDNLAGDTYTFTGTGKLSGATTLTKLGNGTLIFANTGGNDFSGTITLDAGVLQAGDGVTVGVGQLGSGQIVFNGGTLALDHPSGDNITLPNILSGAGTVTQEGADTVTVTGNNLGFGGTFQINSGTFKVGSANGLGAASVSVQSGANLDITGYSVANALGLNGGTLESISGTGTGVTGPITLNGGGVVSVAASSTLNISGAIGGTGGLVSSGSGLLILSGNNSYSGTTAVNAGTLQLANVNALGSSADPTSIASGAILDIAGYAIAEPIQFNGGTLRSSTGSGGAVSGIVTVGASGGTVDVPTGATLTLSNSVNGSGPLTKSSAGTLVLSGNNGYSGGLALNAGVLEFANAAAVPATGQVSLANGVTVAFGFDFDQTLLNDAIAPTFNTATIALAANDTHDLNFANFAGASLGAIGNVTYSGTLTPAFVNYYLGGGGGTLTFTSALTGGTNLIVGATGPGTVILTAANSFSGGTTVTAGTLRLGNSAALGLATDPATVNGTLDLNGYNLTVGSLAGTGLVTDNSTTAGTTLLTVNVAGADTFSGSINNGANGRSITLVKLGAGSLLFNKGNGSNYSGGTVINAGTLEVRTNNAQVLPLGSNLTFTGTSLFRSGNNGTGAASLTLGTLTFSAGEGTVQSDQESTGATGTLTFAAAPTRLAGATGNFTLLSTANDPSKYKVVLTTAPATGESLDGGIFFQGADFAAYDPAGYVRALNYATDSNTVNVALASSQASLGSIAGRDVELDGSGSITDQGTDSVRTLKIAGANNLTLDPAATFTVSAGGILKSGGSTAVISGGVELDTGGEGDLVVRTATATDILNIATTISSETADGVTASGSGTLVLSGNNSFTGPINVLGGTLQLGSAAGFGTSSDGIILQTGAALDVTTFSTAKPIQINSATLRSSAGATGDAMGSVVVNGSSTLDVASGAILNIDGTISGSGTLTKTSLGTAKLTAANTFTGNITISSGTILITNSQALGVGPKTVTIGNALRPSLALDGSSGSLNLDPSISFLTSSDGTTNTSGAIVNVAGNNVINGLITVNSGGGGDSDINVQAGTLTLAGGATAATAHALILDGPATGVVSGLLSDGAAALSLTKQGTGTWLVEGANTYSGNTTINAGTLQVNSITITGQPQPLGITTAPVNLGTATTSGTLEYTGTVPATLSRGITVNGVGGGIVKNSGGALLTLSGTLSTTGRPLTFTGGAFDVTGSITGPAANSSLTVSNATVTLAGTSNTYNGPTTVTNGTLIVSGSITGTTSLAVNSGGILSGNGTITTTNANVTVASGGILAPDNDAPLTLSLGTGVLDLSAAAGGTGYLQFELGVSSDEIVLSSGSLNIGSGLLGLNDFSFTNVGGFAPGSYTLFSSGNSIIGSLGANVSGQVLGLNASLSVINGNSLVLNVVPEPGAAPALFAGVSALVGLQRFRRRSRAHQNFTK